MSLAASGVANGIRGLVEAFGDLFGPVLGGPLRRIARFFGGVGGGFARFFGRFLGGFDGLFGGFLGFLRFLLVASGEGEGKRPEEDQMMEFHGSIGFVVGGGSVPPGWNL